MTEKHILFVPWVCRNVRNILKMSFSNFSKRGRTISTFDPLFSFLYLTQNPTWKGIFFIAEMDLAHQNT